MTNQTKKAQEELAFIRSIMEDSQRSIGDNGLGFIVWGFLILAAGISEFLFEYFNLPQFHGWTFLFYVTIGWIFMAVVNKKSKHLLGNPLTNRIISTIWIAVLITMTILGFVGGASGVINLNYMTGVMYTVLGTAYFLQGAITGKTWVKALGFAWWGGSIALYFVSGLPAAIIAATMMIGLQIIPGFIFNRQWKAHFEEKDHE